MYCVLLLILVKPQTVSADLVYLAFWNLLLYSSFIQQKRQTHLVASSFEMNLSAQVFFSRLLLRYQRLIMFCQRITVASLIVGLSLIVTFPFFSRSLRVGRGLKYLVQKTLYVLSSMTSILQLKRRPVQLSLNMATQQTLLDWEGHFCVSILLVNNSLLNYCPFIIINIFIIFKSIPSFAQISQSLSNNCIRAVHPLSTHIIYQLYSIMLLQLEHQHKPKEQAVASPKLQQIASSRVTNKKQQIPQQQQSIFFNPEFYHETSSFNFHIDGLQELHKLSVGDLPPFIINSIQQRKKFSEERVYQAIVQTSFDFVGIHMRDFKHGMKLQMHSMFQTIHNAVEAGIWDGRYEIDESRNKYFSMAKKQKDLLSHITGELVKRNIEEFKQELDEDELGNNSEVMDISSSYHAKSQNYKTKKAQSFVKKIQEEQNRHRYSISQLIQERKIKEVKTEEERREQEEKRENQKKELIRKRLQRQNQILALEKQRRQKIHSQYLKMVSANKKHTFQQMEQRYNKSMLEEQKRKFKVLKELKQQKRPINFEQIQQHMARYEQLRQQNQSFRVQKRQLKESEYQIIASKKPYRSKFYSLAVKSQTKTDDADLKTAMIKRQEDYADHVKRNFMPRTDEKKQQQLQQLIKRINNHKNNTYHSRKYMQEGKRNLQKLHLLIGQLRAKNKLKENISVEQIMQSKQPPKKYKNYLEEIKQSKLKDTKQETIDFQDKLAKKDHQEIHMISKQKEQKARQKEHYLSSSIENIDIHTHMMGNNVVEQNYIEAAKAKMALLKKYHFDDPPQAQLQPTQQT